MNVEPILSRLGGSYPLLGFQEVSSYLASLREFALSLSSWFFLQSSSLLYFTSVSILALTSWLAHSRPSSGRTAIEEEWTNDALSILAKALIPTQSNWYPAYVQICKRAARRMKRCVYVPVTNLFRDLKQGRIELRCASDDLSLLIEDAFEANGWSVHLEFSIKDRLFAAVWLLDKELASGIIIRSASDAQVKARSLIGEAEIAICKAICAEPRLEDDRKLSKGSSHRSSFFQPDVASSSKDETSFTQRTHLRTLSKSVFFCPSLDYVSRFHVFDFLRSLQIAFHSDKRKLAYLSFTTCENPPPILSFKHMCISKLFMRQLKAGKITKTSSPVFCRLHPVLARLTSGPAALIMCNVQNVSSKYATELDQYVNRLTYDPETRAAFIKKAGIQVWREERLYLSWESALLKEGLISRWVLLMGKGNGK